MKQIVWKSLLFLNRIFSTQKKNQHALILPPTSAGSIGDEAVIRGIIDICHQSKLIPSILCWNADDYKDLQVFRIVGTHIFHGSSFYQFLKIRAIFSKFSHLIIAGTDMMDGFYDDWIPNKLIDLGEIGESQKLHSLALGFSVADAKKLTLKRLIQSRINKVVRDPISLNRIKQEYPESKSVSMGADCSTWCPAISSPATKEIINGLSENFITFNMSPPCLLEVQSTQEVIDQVCITIAKFCQTNSLDILIIPHHFQTRMNDLVVCQIAHKKFRQLGVNSVCISHQLKPEETKFLVEKSQLLVTGRMHLALAACCTGTASVCFPYMKKFEGLFELYQLNQANLIDLGHSTSVEINLQQALDTSFHSRSELRNLLTKKTVTLKQELLQHFSKTKK